MQIVVPVLTPFTKDGKVDKETLKEHVRNLIKYVDVVFVNGTTGLGPALSKEEKKETLSAVYDVTDKVIFQVGSLNLNDAVELVNFSKDFHLVGVASYSPYYFQRLPEKWILNYFNELSRKAEHDFYLYNYPSATGYDISAKLVNKIEGIKGLKDTNQDLAHSLEYKIANPHLIVYNGSDSLVYYSLLSLDGTVASVANHSPHLLSAMRRFIKEGKKEKALQVQLIINSMLDVMRRYGQLSSTYSMVEVMMGYKVGYPRPPIYPLSEEEIHQLKSEVEPLKRKAEELISG
ncbi:bifunctional 2-dehydro-3-deoxy-phosphogluconate/2-dehydro-3-deoxy-6-phosphogalactonate aldolase [Stygiolobus caldivivus]|uniref:2-dehydro-3-deoxy-phosphogluconate aldolase n=1 Tax=Stygiolobus caldivivus TaxID=2824673 RepID=A0A8D5U719_9CREN|nr:bifunctional 2-dehydro-3-deoxy-phosphogluconate/2-dehydro-3-deoxy-6-phosphogalactonate aldolase [Stygiolobus caldivivus]BCU70177.1 2-dehydro-3-deoxy-phosphogluconate aldolase [Stygiolobus caldivivus]